MGGAIKGLGFGGETWRDVTSLRSNGVTYTNNLGYPILISVQATSASDGPCVRINGILRAQQYVGGYAGTYSNVTTIVPPGSTYSSSCGNLVFWHELY